MEDKRKAERRVPNPNFRVRQFQRRERVFYYFRRIYLSDTNAFKNVYFAQYFHIMGEAREELLKYVLGKEFEGFSSSGITLLTVKTDLEFKSSTYLFDDLRVEIKLERLSKMKIALNFNIANTTQGHIAAQGSMTIATSIGHKPIPIPEIIFSRLQELFVDAHILK